MIALKKRFADILAGPDEQAVDLAELALLAVQVLALSADPQSGDEPALDADRARRRLGALIVDAEHDLADELGGDNSQRAAAILVSYLGGELRFAGNVDDYYNPSNSNLGWVLEKRRGIPITLAIVYIAVGRALGFNLRGIGFPGHFLVGVFAPDAVHDEQAQPLQLIDPFRARLTSREECMRALSQPQSDPSATLPIATRSSGIDESLFVASSPAAIILRLLENLKQIHLREQAIGPALAALELQLLAAPDSFELRAQQEALVGQVFGRDTGSGAEPELH